jgi:hypothetical protein
MLKGWYYIARAWWLRQWTRLSEENRAEFWNGLIAVINYLWNGLLFGTMVKFAIDMKKAGVYPLWKVAICTGLALLLLEHYYVWFREKWRENLLG